MASIYLQHELTAQEIARDRAKNAAIARNRARGAVRRKDHTPKAMSEMRRHEDNMSEAQEGLIESLLRDLEQIDIVTWNQAAPWFGTAATDDKPATGARTTLLKGQASDVINRLKLRISQAKEKAVIADRENTEDSAVARAKMDRSSAPRDRFEDVPDGYYAVMTEANELGFYRVSTWPDGGRKVQVQASDTLHLIRGWKSTDAILTKIRAVTPDKAGLEYATKLERCWRCGRTLTKSASRDRGMGADCASKY